MSPLSHEERVKRQAIRERHIRREMLAVLNAERGNGFGGWVTARYVVEVLQASMAQDAVPDTDDHAADLLRDLVGSGYAEERDDREFASKPFRLDTWSIHVTSKGTGLLAFVLEPDPLIADPRRRD